VDRVRWGIIGCGDVAEVKAGPGFQKADGSALVAVMRRDVEKAHDFARRHGIARVHATAAALIADPEVDAVYIATPPSSHCGLALEVARAGKPCLVEKPMAVNPAECARMVAAFHDAGRPLWVAYYRRALPRSLLVRQIVADGTVGRLTSVQVELFTPLASPQRARSWRFDQSVAGGGLFFDMGSHSVDIVDFLVGPIADVHATALNTGGAYRVEDLVVASFRAGENVAGTGIWNFNADRHVDRVILTGTCGSISFSLFNDDDIVLTTREAERRFESRNPPHVHQPLIQTTVDELRGRGRCESTGESGLRAAEVMERCVARYYQTAAPGG
jgi:1,5-anhydro-D-fructose reductase (1,5-anhydro-D-mannitol-forming)